MQEHPEYKEFLQCLCKNLWNIKSFCSTYAKTFEIQRVFAIHLQKSLEYKEFLQCPRKNFPEAARIERFPKWRP
jgi:hypothetical protein